jgi:hypothetical protein
LLGFGDRDRASAEQIQTAKAALDASDRWRAAGLLWQEQRGGAATLYVARNHCEETREWLNRPERTVNG